MNSHIKTLIHLTIFSIAMGYMESAIVIYLRELYYPGGFKFPLVALDASIGMVEIFREAATIIMLLGIGILTGKRASQKFAHFIYCFAIWDIFYYIFLWVFLGWPHSLFTWDILFLIPVPWVGPVITPCIVSITMILLALTIIHFQKKGIDTKLKPREWGLLTGGSFVVILSFIWDYLRYTTEINTSALVSISNKQGILSEIRDYIPVTFNWGLFFAGEAVLLYGIIVFISRLNKIKLS